MIDFENRTQWQIANPIFTYHLNRYIRDNQLFLGYPPYIFASNVTATFFIKTGVWSPVPVGGSDAMLFPLDENRVWATRDGTIHFNIPGLYHITSSIQLNVHTTPDIESTNTFFSYAFIDNDQNAIFALRSLCLPKGIQNISSDPNLGNGTTLYLTIGLQSTYMVRKAQSITVQAYNNTHYGISSESSSTRITLIKKL